METQFVLKFGGDICKTAACSRLDTKMTSELHWKKRFLIIFFLKNIFSKKTKKLVWVIVETRFVLKFGGDIGRTAACSSPDITTFATHRQNLATPICKSTSKILTGKRQLIGKKYKGNI